MSNFASSSPTPSPSLMASVSRRSPSPRPLARSRSSLHRIRPSTTRSDRQTRRRTPGKLIAPHSRYLPSPFASPPWAFSASGRAAPALRCRLTPHAGQRSIRRLRRTRATRCIMRMSTLSSPISLLRSLRIQARFTLAPAPFSDEFDTGYEGPGSSAPSRHPTPAPLQLQQSMTPMQQDMEHQQ